MQKDIYLMHNFDYSFLKNRVITSKLLNLVSSIYSLNVMANIKKTNYIKVFTELEKIAKI